MTKITFLRALTMLGVGVAPLLQASSPCGRRAKVILRVKE
jgi:hypothetical protein